MTCRLYHSPEPIMADLTGRPLGKNQKSRLAKLFNEKDFAENYLGGIRTLEAMNQSLSNLKRENAQEFLFFQEGRTADLKIVSREMKNFLTHEEKYLENQAALINSSNLETINSRLILLKDLCWMLQQDVLDNLRKIMQLTGVTSTADVPPHTFLKYHKLNLILNAIDRWEVRGRDSAGIQLTFVLKNEKAMQDVLGQISAMGLLEDLRRTQGDLVNSSISYRQRIPAPAPASPSHIKLFHCRRTGTERCRFKTKFKMTYPAFFAGLDASCETALTHTAGLPWVPSQIATR